MEEIVDGVLRYDGEGWAYILGQWWERSDSALNIFFLVEEGWIWSWRDEYGWSDEEDRTLFFNNTFTLNILFRILIIKNLKYIDQHNFASSLKYIHVKM